MKKKLFDASVWKFLLVGVGNTLLSLVLMFLAKGWVLAVHRHRLRSRGGDELFSQPLLHLPKPRGFLAVCAEIRRQCGGVLPDCLLHRPARRPVGAGLDGAGPGLGERLAKVGGMGLYTVLNYFGQRFFAFRNKA